MSEDIFESTTAYRNKNDALLCGNMFLSIFDGDSKPCKINLATFKKDVVTFGRGADNDIVLLSGLVSRNHGYFRIGQNSCSVHDNNSTNGLNVDGNLVDTCQLFDGVQVRIDDYQNPSKKGVLILFSTAEDKITWQNFSMKDKKSITIGRDPSCNICLNHVSVSKIHAKIIREKDGLFIYDNNSTNGITINGKTISRKSALREKDIVLITNSKLTLSGETISFCCYNDGIGVDSINIVKTVKNGGKDLNIANHISLSIKPCEFVAIVGGSGAGKTTFMNCISGCVRATSGNVVVNGEDLYDNYDTIKNMIGYVPQQDIVYDNLTLKDMLIYTAKLRMPKDTTKEEQYKRVESVIETVELTGKEDTFIRQLSGGQKKRASIAVELLADPNLFFLDEPSSGLDPGTERNLMKTLKLMTQKGKTIILVTHNTLNLHLCDKVIFLGKGGNLCYCGSPENALLFFEVDNFVDIYNKLNADTGIWAKRYSESEYKSVPQVSSISIKSKTDKENLSRESNKDVLIQQTGVIAKRYAKLLINDRQRMMLLILQAPLLALLISLVADDNAFSQYEMTKSVLFALSCSAFWIGILNSIQEVCKERTIFKREYMTGLGIPAYIISKMLVLGILCFVQSILLIVVFWVRIGVPEEGLLFSPLSEMFLTTFLTAFSAAGLGIFVSTLFKSADRAMTVAPVLLMPQILFSGLVFKLSGATKVISIFANCRWAMEGYGTIANLNDLEMRLEQEGLPIVREVESFFEYSIAHLLFAWIVLIVFVVFFAGMAMISLRNIEKN